MIERLSAIREGLREAADGWRPWVDGRDADRDASARNLLQYLALRGRDLRDLQDRLAALGLSSLGGSEGHVEAISVLDDILRRMDRHHHKQSSLLPQLHASEYIHTDPATSRSG